MKKVLIITYYWPPSGGAGVQRWLKFVKYLREFGWEPIIYTPENPESPAYDLSLEKDIPNGITIVKTPIWEPYTAYKKFVGRKKEDKIKAGFLFESETPSLTENISVWIRGNLFIPDARKFWVKPSIRKLTSYLNNNPVDVIVSTGPPHSMHLIALGIKKKLNIPWLADFRDPWTNIDFYDKLRLQRFADRKHKKLEQKVIQNADMMVTVSRNWANDFENLGAQHIEVVTNGYDEDDFQSGHKNMSDKFEILHIGSMNADRNPKVLWEVLGDFCRKDSDFKNGLLVKLIGQTDFMVVDALKKNGLFDNVRIERYMPHQDVIDYASRARLLLLPLNNTPNVNGIIPGKLFEYLGLNRPILCIGIANGDSAKILYETKSGEVVDFNDKDGMQKAIAAHWENFRNDKLVHYAKKDAIGKYTRKNLTKKLSELLNDLA
jgi:glycosyltransferase involved in cell wall biosynthesis